jgi:D-glycerate 3-kinase
MGVNRDRVAAIDKLEQLAGLSLEAAISQDRMAEQSLNLTEFLTRHRLPESFTKVAEAVYVPLAKQLYAWIESHKPGTFLLGINGAQGTGKTTLSNFLANFLRDAHGLCVAELSIDDIYLTRAERLELAERVHPLLVTRGVPGTHDVGLGKAIIGNLRDLGAGKTLTLPRFDKSSDDRRPAAEWPEVTGPVDLVIFEGWCVGSMPQPAGELALPVNRLEADEDSDGTWRHYVNEQLASAYAELFGMLDALVFLQAPGFDAIHRWRLEQEVKLAASAGAGATHIMDEAGVSRFIQHYERITRHNLAQLPERADVVLALDESHAVTRATSLRVAGV